MFTIRAGAWFPCAAVLCSFALPAFAGPQTLEQAWVLAYQNNPSIEAERANLRATDEQVSQALSHWRPSVDATGNIGKVSQYTPAQSPFSKSSYSNTTGSYGVQVTQPLFRGFRTKAETEAAEKQVQAGRARLASAEQKLFLDTASTFLGILRDQTIMDIQHKHEAILRDKSKETKIRVQAGDLTETDTRQSESRLARAKVNRFQVENSLAQGKASFLHLVGTEPEELKAPAIAVDIPKTPDELFQSAEQNNPEVIAALFNSEQAKAEIALNRGSLLPEVNLVGSSSRNYGQNFTVPGREDNSQVLVQVTMPLYRSGADYSKTRAAEQAFTQRKMELNETRRKAREAASNAWQSLKTAEATLEADKLAIEATQKALEGVKEESQLGTRSTLDVLNAEQELLDARIEQVRAQYDRDLAILQIKAAIGQLTTEHLTLPVKPYDPSLHYEDVRGKWLGFSKDDDRYKVEAIPFTAEAK